MNVVLGVSGSIAAYRAADLARELMRQGCTVRVCLTDAAQRFVTPVLFESLTGQPCLQDAFDEPERGRMAHIEWAKEADAIVVAPATANTLAKLAHGLGEDMLTTLAIASRAPLVVAPAMNPKMYADESTQAALTVLRGRAALVVEPASGEVACGDTGQGKLAPIEEIVSATMTVLRRSRALAGTRVLITSGPTHEPLDDVRFVGNRSSGRMGAALARAALLMGADVTVVSGPASVAYPLEARVVRVRTAVEMLAACLPLLAGADYVVGAAAVADYRPESPVSGKIRRSGETLDLRMVRNPDVLASLSRAATLPRPVFVGFAAEPDEGLEHARRKLAEKGLDAIAVNDVSGLGVGFEAPDNALTLLAPGVLEASGRQTKLGCALWLWERVAGLRGR
ncbi:MAG: bifunctional phosphopantothenoylcysteine decarboxylase/phosphopantothenate--cysteine ligase CoaBC [Fimbriimonadaceae bacterium]|nr:bifunctional phosphopantothenoylcysteine decarboxylase/phosphopantothenate--cysteine ligase CoaBC [Fimbriimonadaceae bacterium]